MRLYFATTSQFLVFPRSCRSVAEPGADRAGICARNGRILRRADAGYFAGQLARAALSAQVEFAIDAFPDRSAVAAA